MAIIEEGINGPFRGKVGSVIGSKWKDIRYIKGLPKIKDTKPKPSAKQKAQHDKFALLNQFFQPIRAILEVGFAQFTGRATAINAAFSYNYDHAFRLDSDQTTLDYQALKFSHGALYTAGAEAAAIAREGVRVSWNPKTYGIDGSPDDVAYAIAYNVGRKLFTAETAPRYKGEVLVPVDLDLLENEFHVWLFFAATDKKRVSKTVYIPLGVPTT